MLRLGGVVILMQINSQDRAVRISELLNKVSFYCGNAGQLVDKINIKPLQPFDEAICSLLNKVSSNLLKNVNAKAYPDIVTFAFFCRKANLAMLSRSYENEKKYRLGRGIVFHVAPSNVPINFAYTMVHGLLAGNCCIVKASSKDFAQTRIISEAFNRTLEEDEFRCLKQYINVVEYDRNLIEVTEYFSSICNVRVIWGGDETINQIRKTALPPRAFDITFADRYSLAVINATSIIEINDEAQLAKLANDFYNDTYLYDQNACTSPRLIYWIGDKAEISKAQEVFWNAIYINIKDRYPVDAEVSVEKYMALCKTAIEIQGSKINPGFDNRIMRIEIKELPKDITELRAPGGCFHEYSDTNMDALVNIVDEKFQTLSYYGLDLEILQRFIIKSGLYGIDRIAPIGKTADMGLIWDGYDLIWSESRIIKFE